MFFTYVLLSATDGHRMPVSALRQSRGASNPRVQIPKARTERVEYYPTTRQKKKVHRARRFLFRNPLARKDTATTQLESQQQQQRRQTHTKKKNRLLILVVIPAVPPAAALSVVLIVVALAPLAAAVAVLFVIVAVATAATPLAVSVLIFLVFAVAPPGVPRGRGPPPAGRGAP